MSIRNGYVLALVLAWLMPVSAHAGEGFTIWQEGIELFAEHPLLVAGERTHLTVHLTVLDDHRPVREGRLAVTLQARDGSGQRFESVAPARPGIYVLELAPERTGMHSLLFEIDLPGDGPTEIRVGGIAVFSREDVERFHTHRHEHGDDDDDHDEHDHEHDDDAHIAFSKELQWRMRFSGAPARQEAIAPRLNLSAEVEPVPGRHTDVVAPARGVLRPVAGQSWLRAGQRVQAGDVLAELVPFANIEDLARLRADFEAAGARLRLAQAELARVRDLVGDGVLPERRLLEAEAEAVTARSARDAMRDRLAGARGEAADGETLPLRAVLDGTVISSPVSPGQVVNAGTRVATVLDARRVWLRVHAPAQDIAVLTDPQADPQDLRVRRPGSRDWIALEDAVLVYRGEVLEHGALPLIFEIDNPGGFVIGLPLIASLAAGAPESRVTIPEAAVLDDDGIDVVIVQLGGETFERRPVRLGTRAAGRIAALDGLAAGERVIVDGAYAVLLAGRGPAALDDGHNH